MALTWKPQWSRIYPGVLLGFDAGARFFGVSLGYAYTINDRMQIDLNVAPGLYERHKTLPNLGSSVEFLTSLTLSWRVHQQQRIAVAFGHISNAHLAAYNPGSEMLELMYVFPLH